MIIEDVKLSKEQLYICEVELHHKAFDKMLESMRKNKGWIAACGKNHRI